MKNIMKMIREIRARKVKSQDSSLKVLLFSILLLAVSACGVSGDKNDRVCYEADEWGQDLNIPVFVAANQELTPTGIRVAAGEPLEVSVSGIVNLCPDADVLTSDDIKASVNEWQDSGVEVKAGDLLSIQVSGEYHDRASPQYGGRGLYAYIGKTPPTTPTAPTSANGGYDPHDWWFGDSNIAQENSTTPIGFAKVAGKGAKNPRFFELKDNGTIGGGGGYYGQIPDDVEDGSKLWFRYARTAIRQNDDTARGESLGIDRDGNERYSPWRGFYAWNNPAQCGACSQATIIATCVPVAVAAGLAAVAATVGTGGPLVYAAAYAASYAACVGSWEGGCALDGRLEEALSLRSAAGKKCREFYGKDYDDDEHWVNDAYTNIPASQYDPANPHAENSGGYDIAIGTGCIGTFGKYLEMHIGESQVKLVDKTIPPGCTVTEGDPSCKYELDQWNEQIVKIPEYQLGATDVTSMDLRCYDDGGSSVNDCPNKPYIGKGKYGKNSNYEGDKKVPLATVPVSGELWFKIKDTVSSPAHPEPGYYGDNTGEYTVRVKTTKVNSGFSEGMDSFIKPVRGIIFGYCRIAEELENQPDYDTGNPGARKDDAELAKDKRMAQYTISEEDCGDGWVPGITKRLYQQLVGGYQDPVTNQTVGNPFLNAIRAALVLYVIIYAGMFMLGMTGMNQQEFFHRVLKFGIVAALLSPGSWSFFFEFLFVFFVNGVDNFIAILSSEFAGVVSSALVDPITGEVIKDANGNPIPTGMGDNLFRFADVTLSRFFNGVALAKALGLIFASPIGFLYFLIVLFGMLTYIFTLIKAMVLYLLAMLAVSLLLIIGPIFISMMLFDRTKGYFDNWIKNLINYTFQPVFVLTALAIFNVFVYTFLYELLFYRVCWDNIFWLYVDLGLFEINIPLLSFFIPDGVSSVLAYGPNDNLPSLPISFAMIMSFIIIVHAMLKFVDWMAELSSQLTTGQRTSVASATKSAFEQVGEKMKETKNKVKAAVGAKAGSNKKGKTKR